MDDSNKEISVIQSLVYPCILGLIIIIAAEVRECVQIVGQQMLQAEIEARRERFRLEDAAKPTEAIVTASEGG